MTEENKATSGTAASDPLAIEHSPTDADRVSRAASLRPVGIDVSPSPAGGDVSQQIAAAELQVASRRRPRRMLVVVSLAVCSAILVAAGVHGARSRALARLTPAARPASPTAAAPPPPASVAEGRAAETPASPNSPAGEAPAVWSDSFPGTQAVKAMRASASTAPSSGAPAAPASAAHAQATGVVRVRHVAQGSVWVDGERIKAATLTVNCGVHDVRVWVRGRTHRVDVPCGGEVLIP